MSDDLLTENAVETRGADSLQEQLITAALQCALLGWAVFPCKPDKSPYTPHGYKDASTDPQTIKEWWRRWPNAAIGIACGASGLIFVDCDVKNGVDGIANFEALNIPHAGALHSTTPSDGLHIGFSDPTGGKIHSSAGKLAPGIDIRANGGYIIAPPSVLEGTEEYIALDPWDHLPPFAPEALVQLLLSSPPAPEAQTQVTARSYSGSPNAYAEAALAGELEILRRAMEGTRNDTLNRNAFALGQLVAGGELDKARVEAELLSAALDIGLEETEARRTIQSGMEAGGREPRTRPAETLGHSGARVATGITSIMDESPQNILAGIDDEGNAQAVVALYKGQFLYTTALGWLYWAGTHWESKNADAVLDRAIVDTLIQRHEAAENARISDLARVTRPSTSRVKATEYMLRSILRADIDAFDNDPDLLNCANGVLNLKTGILQPHNSSQRCTYCLKAPYDPDADQMLWLNFLHQALGDNPTIMTFVQEAVGYSLTGHSNEEILFYLHGPTRSGKGTFTETLLAMFNWTPLAAEVDFTTFTAERASDTQSFDLADLKPCRFVAASESNKHLHLNPAKIKSLTGGNLVRCARKYRDFFSYRPQFKIWLSSNFPVNVDVEDDAAWGRLRVIPFPNTWLGRENKQLKAQLRQPRVLTGILAWAVAGAQRWYSHATGLETPDCIQVTTAQARAELDCVGQWLDEHADLTENPEDFTPNEALYLSYSNWCDDNGVTPKRKGALTLALKRKGLDAGASRKWDGKTHRGCAGIRLRTKDS